MTTEGSAYPSGHERGDAARINRAWQVKREKYRQLGEEFWDAADSFDEERELDPTRPLDAELIADAQWLADYDALPRLEAE
jgi:hypothetical protein